MPSRYGPSSCFAHADFLCLKTNLLRDRISGAVTFARTKILPTIASKYDCDIYLHWTDIAVSWFDSWFLWSFLAFCVYSVFIEQWDVLIPIIIISSLNLWHLILYPAAALRNTFIYIMKYAVLWWRVMNTNGLLVFILLMTGPSTTPPYIFQNSKNVLWCVSSTKM
jgi:hypothetical protein